jgi:alpha-L-fucosidase 2
VLRLIANQTIGDSLLNRGAPAVFQIDGNFGGTAAVAEMLLQSHESISTKADASNGTTLVAATTGTLNKLPLIRLLPAVPADFLNGTPGYAKGLLARGGFVVDQAWDGSGKLTSAKIISNLGGSVYVTLGNSTIGSTEGQKVKSGSGSGAVILKLDTVKGKTYDISLA